MFFLIAAIWLSCSGSDQQLYVSTLLQDPRNEGCFPDPLFFERLEFNCVPKQAFLHKLSGYLICQKKILPLKKKLVYLTRMESARKCPLFAFKLYCFLHGKCPQCAPAPLPPCPVALCFGRGAELGKDKMTCRGERPSSTLHTWLPLATSVCKGWVRLQGADGRFPSPLSCHPFPAGMEVLAERGDGCCPVLGSQWETALWI